jgi:hypothetical protein
MATAGWYADPEHRHALRWHDGAAWTEHVVQEGRRIVDPRGAPAGDRPPPAGEEARWLPPPGLSDTPRWGPFAVGVPSGGPAAVPEAGYDPVLTGNRALDLTQNYVNEFESQLRRDASLVHSSAAALRASPALKRLGFVLGVLALAAFLSLLGAGYTIFDRGADGGDLFGTFLLVAVLLVFVLPVVYVIPSVVAFASGVAAGLDALEGRRASRLVRAVLRARRAVGALALARLAWWAPGLSARAGAALYEAFAVFAVPVAIEQGLALPEAQRRSEELVAARWGPGRFRALGLPQTSPWSVVYSRGVTRYGYKAPYIAAAVTLLVLLGPLFVALAIGEPAGIVIAFAWMWGIVALGGLVWSAVAQPLLQGLLRAHLYHYAKTGAAVLPFEEPALHACLREEARARLGLPQRKVGQGRRSPPLGLSGVVRSFAADPAGYAQSEAGLAPSDIRAVITDARLLYKDGRLVTKALKGRELDAGSLVAATGLPPERCRVAVINLIWAGKVRADVSPAGDARFSLAG